MYASFLLTFSLKIPRPPCRSNDTQSRLPRRSQHCPSRFHTHKSLDSRTSPIAHRHCDCFTPAKAKPGEEIRIGSGSPTHHSGRRMAATTHLLKSYKVVLLYRRNLTRQGKNSEVRKDQRIRISRSSKICWKTEELRTCDGDPAARPAAHLILDASNASTASPLACLECLECLNRRTSLNLESSHLDPTPQYSVGILQYVREA